MTRTLTLLLAFVIATFGIRSLMIISANQRMPEEIASRGKRDRSVLQAKMQKRKLELVAEYDRKKHLATGKDAYQRIFNTPDQSISTLIERLTEESFPEEWDVDIRVEEFTHFIMLVYLPQNYARVEIEQIVPYLKPILQYSQDWLTDVAVYDSTHTSYLFLDKAALKDISGGRPLSKEALTLAQQRGKQFSRFNSTIIQCERRESHLYVPTEIFGPDGFATCWMLLDTGASMTMISESVWSQTEKGYLRSARHESFRTANGMREFPVIYRSVSAEGDRRRKIEVCVGDINLLGMNYFDGLKFIVSSSDACIYVWEE